VIPEVSTDIGVAIGKHYINGAYEARILQNRDSASVVAKYNVQDRHDFDPDRGLVINQAGVGLVPHRWIISLEKAGYAKAFDISIAWAESMYVRWK
jgi:hypothetical protein